MYNANTQMNKRLAVVDRWPVVGHNRTDGWMDE